jgi:hypothetical protein
MVIKLFEHFVSEDLRKKQLLGKKFYHGTTLETWKQSDHDEYLFIVDEFEVAKKHADDRTESMVELEKNPFTSIVVEVVINEKIINLDWHVDDNWGNWSRPPINFKHWWDSYEGAGSFVISGKLDISDFKIVYSNKFFPE